MVSSVQFHEQSNEMYCAGYDCSSEWHRVIKFSHDTGHRIPHLVH